MRTIVINYPKNTNNEIPAPRIEIRILMTGEKNIRIGSVRLEYRYGESDDGTERQTVTVDRRRKATFREYDSLGNILRDVSSVIPQEDADALFLGLERLDSNMFENRSVRDGSAWEIVIRHSDNRTRHVIGIANVPEAFDGFLGTVYRIFLNLDVIPRIVYDTVERTRPLGQNIKAVCYSKEESEAILKRLGRYKCTYIIDGKEWIV